MNNLVYDGGCHCKSLTFRYNTTVSPEFWSVRACQCRFCRMHDALSTSDANGTLQFFAHQPAALQRYRFALRTADFLVCRLCGVYIGAVIETAEGSFGIINTHAFNDTPANIAKVVAIRYDEEDAQDRIGRRQEKWTPVIASPW
jgi:hypothetical protein